MKSPQTRGHHGNSTMTLSQSRAPGLRPSSAFQTPTKSVLRRAYSTNSARKSRLSASPYTSLTPSSSVSCRSLFSPSGSESTSDRFIPSRRGMNVDFVRRAILSPDRSDRKRKRNNTSNSRSNSNRSNSNQSNTRNNDNRNDGDDDDDSSSDGAAQAPQETPIQKEFKRRMLSSLCNIPLDKLDENAQPVGLLSYNGRSSTRQDSSTRRRSKAEDPYSQDNLRVFQAFENLDSPLVAAATSDAITRKIPSAPIRILDAPDLVDDYYLNLISWSSDNILAVALAQCVYLWNASTGEIQHLCTVEGAENYVTSVSWCTQSGQTKYLSIGTNSCEVQLWDCQALRLVRTLRGHNGRVTSLAWGQGRLSSGARDSLILNHDLRSANHITSKYRGHEQEVCGLQWNEDGTTLASGGNENLLCIWDAASSSASRRRGLQSNESMPRLVLRQHKAAVKALNWCPFHRGMLASGGGTADRTIKLWNSNSGAMLNSIDTGSQVCSLLWSKHNRELVSSHGFSENQLILWKYGSGAKLIKAKEFTGHTSRVLSLAASPDGSTVVSAAGDETLRFWNIFGAPKSKRTSSLPLADLSFGMPTIR